MHDLFVAGTNNKSAAFYDTEQLVRWLQRQGIDGTDPIWDYLQQLIESN